MKGTIDRKVLYIGGFELPDKNAAAHRVLANGKILNDIGIEVVYVGISQNTSIRQELIATKSHQVYGIDFKVKYPSTKREWLKYLINTQDIIKIIETENINILIAYNYPSISLYRLMAYCKSKKIKIIADCTEWYMPKEENLVFRIIKGLDTKLRMMKIQPKLDGLIVISMFLYNYYSKIIENVILLPPLVDLNESKWNRSNFNFENNKIRKFIYAGSPGIKTKDQLGILIPSFIQAANSVDVDYRLDILGITKGQFYKIWDDISIPIAFESKIIFHGRVPNSIVIEKLKASDFSIFLREDNLVTRAGFPTKFVESITSGIPVITNRSSDLEKYLQTGKNGFFLNIESKKDMITQLRNILTLDDKTVLSMKKFCCASKEFSYINYRDEVKIFLDAV
jgi:glycosyltransferase involved in cell wall biosynthesis